MRLRNGVAACAVSVLAMVFSVQQSEHGPLVVYKLQVPTGPSAAPAATPKAEKPQRVTGPSQPRLRSSITNVPRQPATRSLGTVVMPASALPPPRVTPVPVAPVPVTTPRRVPLPLVIDSFAAEPSAAQTQAATQAEIQVHVRPASLQPRVLGTVAASEVEALDDYGSALLVPSSQDVFHIVEESEFGTAMINEETGDNLTLDEVNDAALWRRDTAERLRQVPLAPRF